MFKKRYLSIIAITLYCIYCYIIYQEYQPNKKLTTINTISNTIIGKQHKKEETKIGTITIDKINLSQNIYQQNNKHNNVEENVTILKGSIPPQEKNSIMFLAAHSGYGDIAYFNNLDQISLKDTIKLEYNNDKFTYEVTKIEQQPKTGKIIIEKNKDKELILTTCSKNDKQKQLVITSKIK